MREDALGAYGQALATIETLRQGSVRADESRTTFLATTGGVFEEAAGALAEMALLTQAGPSTASASVEGAALKYAAQALDVVERGRARSLLDMLNESGAEIAGDDVPRDLLEQRRANQARQAEIAAQLMGVNLGESEKEKKPKELEEELDDLQNKFDVIENDIRTKSRRYNSLTGGVPLTLEEIRGQVLDDDTALLEYSLGEERSYLLAVTPTDFRVSRLPGREEVGRLVVDFRRQLLPTSARRSLTDLVAAATDPQRGLKVVQARPNVSPALVKAYAEAARALYAATVEPAAPLFKGSRLLVVADGALNYVPFHALVTAAPPEGADFTALEYLLRKNETVFAPSASVVAAIRQQRASAPDTATAGGMLVVADPVFDASDSRAGAAGVAGAQQAGADAGRAPGFDSAVADVAEGVKGSDMQAAAGARRVALVRLAGTGEEAAQIKELAGRAGRQADVWTGLQANEGELEERDLRGYRVLHFATHGLLNAERPQFTGVVLSLVGNRGGADGFLRADEVYNLRLGSPLVMLSACETGLGREKRGEGVMGLTRAFMYAGAPTVGVTLWPVADRQTADLMGSFYRTLLGAQPATASAAMHQARLAMLARKESSAPFYWAPFVLVGDWK
jgi:CHAT domain-containing protein